MTSNRARQSHRGQTLVIVALGMAALIGMVGVVIDVGLQWGANRDTQNGSDASAHAGAVVIMKYLAGDATLQDAHVDQAVTNMAAETGITLEAVHYTDYLGARVGVAVGSGGPIPAGAQGVEVIASETHDTFLAQIVGITQLTATTDAVAVTGPVEDPCSSEGAQCPLIPVTVPNTQVTCGGQNKSIITENDWDLGVDIVVPFCGNNPGSVGWIDWTPPAGGDSELAAEICNPDQSIALPDWFYVTATGNTNSDPVQTCFENWIDEVIYIPLFDDTCRINPAEGNPCPAGEEPSGQNNWYHFPSYASFYLTGVYIKGNQSATCDQGNGATSCITGRFVDTSGTGTVSQYLPPDPDSPPISEFFSVQLIR